MPTSLHLAATSWAANMAAYGEDSSRSALTFIPPVTREMVSLPERSVTWTKVSLNLGVSDCVRAGAWAARTKRRCEQRRRRSHPRRPGGRGKQLAPGGLELSWGPERELVPGTSRVSAYHFVECGWMKKWSEDGSTTFGQRPARRVGQRGIAGWEHFRAGGVCRDYAVGVDVWRFAGRFQIRHPVDTAPHRIRTGQSRLPVRPPVDALSIASLAMLDRDFCVLSDDEATSSAIRMPSRELYRNQNRSRSSRQTHDPWTLTLSLCLCTGLIISYLPQVSYCSEEAS